MANPFDKFDSISEGNPFDQFDSEEPKQGIGEFLSNKALQGAHSVIGGGAFLAGGLTSAVGAKETSDDLFGFYEHLQDPEASGVATDDEKQSLPLRVGGGVTQAIPILAGFAINPAVGITGSLLPSIADAGANTKEGVSASKTAAILGVDAISNIIGYKIPASVGSSLLTKVGTGATANVGLGAGADVIKQEIAGDNEEVADKYDPTNLDARITDALFGGIAGASHTKRVPKVEPKIEDLLADIDSPPIKDTSPLEYEPSLAGKDESLPIKQFENPTNREGGVDFYGSPEPKGTRLTPEREEVTTFLTPKNSSLEELDFSDNPSSRAALKDKAKREFLTNAAKDLELIPLEIPKPTTKPDSLDFEKVIPGDVPKTRQDNLILDQGELSNFRKQATPQQGVDFIQKIPTDVTNYNKGEPGQFDLKGINNQLKPSNTKLGGTGKTGFRQGGAINFSFGERKPQTLEQSAKSLNVQDWTERFLKDYPQYENRPDVAAQVYKRLNAPSIEKAATLNEFIDNSETLKSLDKVLGSSSTRIGNASQPILHRAIRYEKDLLVNTHKSIATGDQFFRSINKLPKNIKQMINNQLTNNNFEGLNNILKKINKPELVTEFDKMRQELKSKGVDLQSHNRLENMRQDYFPRIVKDLKGLLSALGANERNVLGDRLADARKAAAKLGQSFTEAHESKVVNDFLRTRSNRANKPGFSKERKIDEVTPDLEKFYASPVEAYHSYMRNAVSEIETAKFFARNGKVDPKTGKLDIENSIGEITAQEMRNGKISRQQAVEIESILKSRFGPGNTGANGLVQGFKDITNIGMLGGVTSAIVQGGDIASSIVLNGLRPTLMSVVAQARGKTKVSMKDFGLADHISQEFVSQKASSKALNTVFKASGFAGMDRFGKTTLLDSTIRSYEKQVKTAKGRQEFSNKWKERFGDEYPQLLKDLQEGKRTELTDMLAFSQLSKVQPISRIEMPQKYLDSPNGRLFYMLKTFALKQVDLVRNEAYNEIKKGNVRKGLGFLMRYSIIMGSAGATTQYITDWLLGRDFDPELSDVPLNVFKIFSLNEYNMAQIKEGKVGEALRDAIIPPYRMFDEILTDAFDVAKGEEASGKSVKTVPLLGKWYYNNFLGGAEKFNDYKESQEE